MNFDEFKSSASAAIERRFPGATVSFSDDDKFWSVDAWTREGLDVRWAVGPIVDGKIREAAGRTTEVTIEWALEEAESRARVKAGAS